MSPKLKWSLIALTAVAATGTFVLVVGRTQNRPITIAFVGFTNAPYADRPLAVFVGTNTSSKTLTYAKTVERKTEAGWPIYVGPLPHGDGGRSEVPEGQAFRFLEYPPRDAAPWRVSIVYSLFGGIWEERRWGVAEFFYERNLPLLGELFHEGVKGFLVAGPEMQNGRVADRILIATP